MPGPFVVAHRAGNDLAELRRAERLPVEMIEADVHLCKGRLEVRHLKTAGPLPVLWDRWRLASARAPRLLLDRLLATAGAHTHLMLDLKGRDAQLAVAVADAAERRRPGRAVTVCSRSWPLLDAVRGVPGVRVIHSVGSGAQLGALRTRLEGGRLAGVSIHRRLLTPAVVAELRARAGMVITWPVADLDDALALADWGVDGVITESFEALATALAGLREDRAA